MAIRRFSTADLTGRKGSSMIGGYGWGWSEMDSIATVTVGAGGASEAVFASIPSTYQHLQIRWTARGTRSATSDSLAIQFNDVTIDYYQVHQLYGDGATAGAYSSSTGTNIVVGDPTAATATASVFGSGVTDILDYTPTGKNKTVRTFGGFDRNGAGTLSLNSGAWFRTTSVTKIRFFALNANLAQHSTFALYGIKAP